MKLYLTIKTRFAVLFRQWPTWNVASASISAVSKTLTLWLILSACATTRQQETHSQLDIQAFRGECVQLKDTYYMPEMILANILELSRPREKKQSSANINSGLIAASKTAQIPANIPLLIRHTTINKQDSTSSILESHWQNKQEKQAVKQKKANYFIITILLLLFVCIFSIIIDRDMKKQRKV